MELEARRIVMGGATDTIEMPPVLATCVLAIDDAIPEPVDAAPTERSETRETRTLLGVPPLAARTRETARMLAPARPMKQAGAAPRGIAPPVATRTRSRTRRLDLAPRGPAPLRPASALRAMTTVEDRFWYFCALGAGVLVATLVLASAYLAGV